MSIYKSATVEKQFNQHYQDVLNHWELPYKSHFVSTAVGETHILTFGNPEGQPLLMLTGGNGIAAHWGLGDNPLAAHFRIFAPDTPGQPGKSTAKRPKSSDESYARWLLDLIEHFSLEKIHVLGISFGGWLSLKLAITFPERVHKLVLIAPSGIVPLNSGTMLRMLPRLLFTRTGAEYFIDRVAAKPLDPYLKSSMLVIYNSLKPAMPVHQPLFSDEQLSNLQHPTLLLVGEADILIPAEACIKRATRLIPDIDATIVHQAGHILPSDQADIFATKVITHLS